MPYTSTISVSLGSSKTGLSLSAQLVNTTGSNVGDLITTGFAELGQGNYLWTYDQFPDNFRGGIKFYNTAAPTILLAATSVNPEDSEFIAKIDSIVTATPKEITIQVPQISGSNSISITNGSSSSSRNVDIKTGVR